MRFVPLHHLLQGLHIGVIVLKQAFHKAQTTEIVVNQCCFVSNFEIVGYQFLKNMQVSRCGRSCFVDLKHCKRLGWQPPIVKVSFRGQVLPRSNFLVDIGCTMKDELEQRGFKFQIVFAGHGIFIEQHEVVVGAFPF